MTQSWRREYDVYIDGKGYFLVKTGSGSFQSGASQDRESNPFTRHLSEEGRHAKQEMTFDGGAGSQFYDGSGRYETGENIDTRSGVLELAPEWAEYHTGGAYEYITEPWPDPGPLFDNGEAVGVQIRPIGSLATPPDIMCVGVMLGSSHFLGPDWANVKVELYTDSTGEPGTLVDEAILFPNVSPANSKPWEVYGSDYKCGWVEAVFPVVQADTPVTHWIVVTNNSTTRDLIWPHTTVYTSPDEKRWATYNGVDTWTPQATEGARPGYRFPVLKARDRTEPDGFVRHVLAWATLTEELILFTIGNKLFYYDEATHDLLPVVGPDTDDTGAISDDGFDGPIIDIFPFYFGTQQGQTVTYDPRLYITVARADGVHEIWLWKGDVNDSTSPNNNHNWYFVPGTEGDYFGYARGIIWKSHGASLNGAREVTDTGNWNNAYAYIIGNPQTPILEIKPGPENEVIVLKPEGLFQVYIPDGYPAADIELEGTLLVDLSGERVGRGWLEYMGAAAYFPLDYGMGEYQAGYFRDTWIERKDPDGGLHIVNSWDPYYGRFTAAEPLPRSFWMGKSAGVPDGLYNVNMPTDVTELSQSRGAQIWSWDGRGFHPTVTETRYQAEVILTLQQISIGGGFARVWYGHGFDLRLFEIPAWTQDRAQGDVGQTINSFYPLKSADPTANNRDVPWVTLPVFAGTDPNEEKLWVGVTVHYEQISSELYNTRHVMIKAYIRYFNRDDWTELPESTIDLTLDAAGRNLAWSNLDWGSGSKDFVVENEVYNTRHAQVKLEFYPSDTSGIDYSTSNIKVSSIDLIYDVMPDPIIQYELVIAAADHQQLHVGGKDSRVAENIVDELRALVKDSPVVSYVDLWGNTRQVRAMGLTEQPYAQVEEVPNTAEGFVIESAVAVSLLNAAWP